MLFTAPRPRALLILLAPLSLALCALTASGCENAGDGSEHTDVASDIMVPEPDTGMQEPPFGPGSCFEVFGPPGISHDAPRQHDAGVVTVGQALTREVRFYNFCSDFESTVRPIAQLDVTPGLDVVVDGPAPGTPLTVDQSVTVTLVPSAPGMQQATVRFDTDHGYYDFTIALEAVAADGAPAALDADCLLLESSALDFDEVAVGGHDRQSFWLDALPSCELSFGAQHLIVAARIEGGDGAFELRDPSRANPSVDEATAVVFESRPGELERSAFEIGFVPQASGSHEAELVLTTNEPIAEHRIALSGTAP